MELEELKNRWTEFDSKLEKSLRLNKQLVKNINLNKVKNKLVTVLITKLLEMGCLALVGYYIINSTYNHTNTLSFIISASILIIFIFSNYISLIKQLSIIIQLLNNVADDITSIQKKLSRLKLLVLNATKYTLFLIPLYPTIIIVLGKTWLNVDFTSANHISYLIANIIVGLTLMPLIIWIFRQLGAKEIKQPWVKSLLLGSGWNRINHVKQFLDEIEEFEKE